MSDHEQERLSEIPMWLRVHERIDYYLFIGQKLVDNCPTSPIELMVDQATGASRDRERRVERISRHLVRLKCLYDKVTSKEKVK